MTFLLFLATKIHNYIISYKKILKLNGGKYKSLVAKGKVTANPCFLMYTMIYCLVCCKII